MRTQKLTGINATVLFIKSTIYLSLTNPCTSSINILISTGLIVKVFELDNIVRIKFESPVKKKASPD